MTVHSSLNAAGGLVGSSSWRLGVTNYIRIIAY